MVRVQVDISFKLKIFYYFLFQWNISFLLQFNILLLQFNILRHSF